MVNGTKHKTVHWSKYGIFYILMEFHPFWELLDKLGISLPNSLANRQKQLNTPAENPRQRRSAARPQRHEVEQMLDLLDATIEFGELPTSLRDEVSTSKNCWVSPGETVEVAGYRIPGMVYVGDSLPMIGRYGVEPSLIRPMLRAKSRKPDYERVPKKYSTSYTQLEAVERAAYLKWLSEGRNAPKVYGTYVWLFFYGLERRVLHDLLDERPTIAPEDLPEFEQIVAEVKRLRDIYGNPRENWSFANKTETFLEICRFIRSSELPEELIDPMAAKPFALQIGLGQKVKQGQPLPAEWAIAWYTRLANNALPTAATRCTDEFKTLFQLRYQQNFGEGIKLKPGKTKLKTSYFPSNPSFGRSLEIPVGDLPDISRFTAKVTQIGEVMLQCRKELDPLSRFLARNPDAQKAAAAIALLPADLLPLYGGDVLQNLRTWLDKNFAQPKTQVAVVSGKEVLKHWSGSNPEKLTKTEANGLANTLTRLGYGIEPDPQLTGTLPTLKNSFALFRRIPDSDNSDELELSDGLSEEYVEATLLMQLAIAAASGDETPNAIEQQYLETHLASVVAVEEWERSRLSAHLHLLLHESNLRGLKARIAKLKPAQRQEFAQFVVQVATADGQATPQEVQVLEKIYKQLELDSQTLYSDIHAVSTSGSTPSPLSSQPASEPVTVRKATPTQGHKIPAPPKGNSKKQELALDMSLVQSKLTESQEISSILADIFVDEEVSPSAKSPSPSTTKTDRPHSKTTQRRKSSKSKSSKSSELATPIIQVAGLDQAHSELLFTLQKQAHWQREELEAIAAQLDLMLDGALEVINEAAFDRCDEAVTEGDDPVEVNSDVLRKLLA
ncbi:TerB N-terminal domain-containing protein [Leptolyngbya sp. FACHB-671]|uniref:tellurite resistance TerB family protein n=1 Tax=Leptolyngbya sp. FACHB-671 TaxID=2692812 RepID=UPI001683C4CE|nr:TerB N-terminal domain-containing protein [Leptolyngbya sp. FACHB-671]MBD2068264.1 TerB N-terminal domain-containing protein [Leptolyngbya sp. FACHB-671]